MGIQVEVPYSKTFRVRRPQEQAYDYFWNVRESIPANFKGLKSFEQLRADTYRWEFESFGYRNYEIKIVLVSEFSGERANHIAAKPIAEPGASEFRGSWRFAPAEQQTDVTLELDFKIELPVPFFVKAVAVPIAQSELRKLFDRYVGRVSENCI